MKIISFSDTHFLRMNGIQIPNESFDLLIFCGDMCNGGLNPLEVLESFTWFSKFKANKKIIIPGNHDRILETNFLAKYYKETLQGYLKQVNDLSFWKNLAKEYNLDLVEDGLVEYKGLKIYCSAYSIKLNNWVFGLTKEEYERYLSKIPRNIDILACHNMPYVESLSTSSKSSLEYSLEDNGSYTLTKAIKEIKPKVFLGGHWHRDFKQPHKFKIGKTNCYNVSLLDNGYRLFWDFTTLEL